MVKLEITIKEKDLIELSKVNAYETEIIIKEKDKNITPIEKRALEILKNRINTDIKLQLENETNYPTESLVNEFIFRRIGEPVYGR